MSDDDVRFRLAAGGDAYATPPEQRDPTRRFRGRLAAPVTIWTAADTNGQRAGLTVSSLVVVEGEPARVLGLVGSLTEWWDAAESSGRFVVHVAGEQHMRLADDFAGRLPRPGAPFGDLAVSDSRWGPVLDDLPTRAYCSIEDAHEVGYALVVMGVAEKFEFGGPGEQPLVHYRGAYFAARPRRP